MSKLKVIGVSKNPQVSDISCVYMDNKPYVYHTDGELSYQHEIFQNLNDLSYLNKKDAFEWTYFEIEKGDLIRRGNIELYAKYEHDIELDTNDEILKIEINNIKEQYENDSYAKEEILRLLSMGIFVNDKLVKPIDKLKLNVQKNSYTLKALLYKMLKYIYNSNDNKINELEEDYKNNIIDSELKINDNLPIIDNFNKELIVRTRLDGYYYLIDLISSTFRKYEPIQEYKRLFIYYLFSRLFILEKHHFINLDNIIWI